MLFFLSSASFSFWSKISWDEGCLLNGIFSKEELKTVLVADISKFDKVFCDQVKHSGYQKKGCDWREGFGLTKTLFLLSTRTCVGGAAGEVGGDTLLLGFFTAGESTISKALPAWWWIRYEGPWQRLNTKQVLIQRRWKLPPRVSNSCLVAASTSAISSSLAWGRGSAGAGRRSPASSAGAVTDLMGGLDEGLAEESPTWCTLIIWGQDWRITGEFEMKTSWNHGTEPLIFG